MIYTSEQILFINNKKKENKTYPEISKEFTKKYGRPTNARAMKDTYIRYQNYSLDEITALCELKGKKSVENRNKTLAAQNSVLLNESLKYDDFVDSFLSIIPQLNFKMHKQIKIKSKKPTTRTLLAHISDTHIGVRVNKKELGGLNEFNPTICARRFAFYFRELVDYKPEHRDETDLVIVINGDEMAGIIHNQEHGVELMTNQFAQALSIFSQGISYCSQHFKSVTVHCTTGNHTRYMHKENKGRSLEQKWDSFSTNLYIALREVFKSYSNVNFNIPVTPYCTFKIFEHNFYATHGDTIISVGNVGKSINTASITNFINNLNSGFKDHISVFLMGHLHVNTFQTLNNGVELLINGTLSGLDAFAQGIGINHNNPSQQIFEVTKDHAVGDFRSVRLKQADGDKELDNIIEPMVDLF